MWNAFFRLSGRFNRAKFWGYSVLLAFLYVLLTAAAVGIGVYVQGEPNSVSIVLFVVLFVILFIIWTMLVWYANIAIGVKRLHDRGKSGWWMFLYYVVPAAMQQHGVWSQPGIAIKIVAGVLAMVGIGILVWAFIDLGCLRGTEGKNAYGPDPLAPTMP